MRTFPIQISLILFSFLQSFISTTESHSNTNTCTSKDKSKCNEDYKFYEEIISTQPDVRFLYDFLLEGEAEHLINNFKSKLSASGGVAADGKRIYGDWRTSSSGFLKKAEDDVILGIEKRIAKYTNSTLKQMEPLQLLNYKKGQKFNYHLDYFTDEHVISEGGQR